MRLIIAVYYFFYLLSGGFRHYEFDYIFSKSIQGEFCMQFLPLISWAELILLLLTFVILLFPLKKSIHLLFFILLFVLDLFFQNKIGFMSCFILPHFFPLFFYLFLQFESDEPKRNLVLYAAMLFVSVGYLASFTSKMNSMWLNPDDIIIFSYILEFYKGFHIPSLFSDKLLEIKSPVFWKALDYLVLVFQLSFILIFFKKKYFYYIAPVAVLFHLGILFSLGIGVVFYLYILFYALIFFSSTSKLFLFWQHKTIDIVKNICVLIFFVFFVSSSFKVQFFNDFLSFNAYIFAEYFYTAICVLIFGVSFYYWKKSNLSDLIISHEHIQRV